MTDRARLSVEDIKRAANARMFDVLRDLGISDKPRAGGYIHIPNPIRKDRKPSFTIWTKNGIATFKDHATGEMGDIIGLVAYLKSWTHLSKKGVPEVCRHLSELLGLERVSGEQLVRDRENSRRQEREILKKSAEEEARKQGDAFKLWMDAEPILGSRADVYLRQARGIDLAELPRGPRGGSRLPSVLRCLQRHEHKESGQSFPCMIAACVDYAAPEPKIRAVHRTWLRHDGRDKAPVEPQRKVWPAFRGLVIPLWKGESNLSIGEAIANGLRETLVLCEGIETGLSAVLARPDLRVWAVISLSNLGNVPVPECIDGIIVHRENDWHSPQASKAFEAGVARLEQTGVPVVEAPALSGSDWNDTLRGED